MPGFFFSIKHLYDRNDLEDGVASNVDEIKASSYMAQYPVLRPFKALYTLLPDRPVHSDTISASLGSIQPYAQRLLVHISTTLYSQVLIYTAE